VMWVAQRNAASARIFGKSHGAGVATSFLTKEITMTATSDRLSEVLLRIDPPRDPLTGRLLKDLTPRALAAVLKKYPCLKQVAPKLPDPNAPPNWTVTGRFNGELVVAPEDALREQARSAALLRDPMPVKHTPTKPRRHDGERAMAAAYHEAGHATLSLLLGLRVPSATIVPEQNMVCQQQAAPRKQYQRLVGPSVVTTSLSQKTCGPGINKWVTKTWTASRSALHRAIY
jgi:hypothetical protein